MTPHLARVLCAVFISCFLIPCDADDPTFPQLKEIFVEFYETQVSVTNLDQKITALATEYYDNSVPRGVVDLLVVGNRYSVFYNNGEDMNQITEVNSTTCTVDDADISNYDSTPIFYGWLNKSPLVIGPTAPLWLAQSRLSDIKYAAGSFSIRDIMCEKWTLDVLTKTDNVTYSYFFANSSWTTPYGMGKMRVPIRIEVRGQSSVDVAGDQQQPINQYTDFAYFKPSISDWRVFQPPVGLGCESRKSSRTIPKIPKVFKFSAEVYDLLKAEEHAESDVEFVQVWYDYDKQLARLDSYTRLAHSSELYDFNTGVTYTNKNDQTCRIRALRGSFFETYFSHAVVGHLKNPEEVFRLDIDYYYMGEKLIRGIWTQVFESVEFDALINDKFVKKLVVTAYFSKDNIRVSVTGEEESKIPVFYQVKAYDDDNKIVFNKQINIFGFDDLIYPEMYQSFQLARCFPTMQDKTYFIMFLNVQSKLAAIMEGQDEGVITLLREQITTHAKIHDLRLPMLRADYKSSGVFVTGLMLDRPPALKQFWKEYEGETDTQDDHLKVVVEADTQEKCAMACVKEVNITCLGFYWCGAACYLKSKDILGDVDPKEKEYNLGVCQTWMRAEKNSLGLEPYLADAIKNLETAVLKQEVSIQVQVDLESQAKVPVQDIVIGDGPYTGDNNQEKPYDVRITFAKLKVDDMSTQEVEYVATLNDCYKACKDSESISCSSFSYCPDSSNKQCLLSSNLVIDRKNNPDDTEDDKNCYVYSLKYLDFYTAYPGRSLLISGDAALDKITTAEECAKGCRTEERFACRGFEFCRSQKTCVLHSRHVLDLKPGEMGQQDKKSSCTHYAARFTADYYDMGFALIEDDSNSRSELSLEECAKSCSEELKGNCRSFNYCPASQPYTTDSSCSLSARVLTDKDIKTTSKDKCHHYEKKKEVDDWAKVKTTGAGVQPTGYTSKGFAGLVVAMLALGLVLGAVGFVIYSYYRSRSHGEGMSVRFMKSDI